MFSYFSDTVPEYCKAHPTAVLPKGDNCVQYYNCSVGLTRYGRNVMECTYPDMFSTVTSQCERFTSVSCKDRPEHQAPCKLYTILEYIGFFLNGSLKYDYFKVVSHVQNLQKKIPF